MNSGSSDVYLKHGKVMGNISEIDAANIKFNKNVVWLNRQFVSQHKLSMQVVNYIYND